MEQLSCLRQQEDFRRICALSRNHFLHFVFHRRLLLVGASTPMGTTGTIYGKFLELVFAQQGEILSYGRGSSPVYPYSQRVQLPQCTGTDPPNNHCIHRLTVKSHNGVARPVDMV